MLCAYMSGHVCECAWIMCACAWMLCACACCVLECACVRVFACMCLYACDLCPCACVRMLACASLCACAYVWLRLRLFVPVCSCVDRSLLKFLRLHIWMISNSDELETQGITEEFAIFNVATSRISYVGKVMKKTNEIEALTKARAPYFPTPP